MSSGDSAQPHTPEELQTQLRELIATLETAKRDLETVAPRVRALEAALHEDEKEIDAMDRDFTNVAENAARKMDAAVLAFIEDGRERGFEAEEALDED